MDVLTLGF